MVVEEPEKRTFGPAHERLAGKRKSRKSKMLMNKKRIRSRSRSRNFRKKWTVGRVMQ